LHDLLLKLLASIFAIADELLVFGDVLLEVVEHLKFLVESDQRVKLVLQLNFLLLKRELELVLLSLVEHSLREALRRRGHRHSRLRGSLFWAGTFDWGPPR